MMTSSYLPLSASAFSTNVDSPVETKRHQRAESSSCSTNIRSMGHPLGGGKTSEPIALRHTDCVIRRQVPLAKLTSFKVGGPAELFVAPRNLTDLQASLLWAAEQGQPVTLLGAGSNLLISDRGLSGLVVSSRYLRNATFDDETCQLTAGAGEPIARLAWKAAERGWSGLEWAAGIPGTVGGAVVMNAGAHKLCAADVLLDAHVLTTDQEHEIMGNEQLGFQYRTSVLQGSKRLVTQATFQLQPGHSPEEIKARTRSYLDHRHTTQPYNMPNCGSVFRNPGPKTAGWLIEQTGLKGYQIGQAQVAQRHANFILNLGQARANDIRRLIEHVQAQVEHHWSLSLHPEVKFMGEF